MIKIHDNAELVVYDETERCPYLADRVARMPLRYRNAAIGRAEFDQCLAGGDRRTGPFLYRPQCPTCCACEAIRIPVADFSPGKTMRRVKRRGDRLLETHIDMPVADETHLRLFNEHRLVRGLAQNEGAIGEDEYQGFLVSTCCETFEITYRLNDELVAVAITDRGEESLSAVYCYFAPDQPSLSLGTYSILKQVELCREWKLRYLYLGLYIAECRPMSYKSRFLPHERLISGQWQRFNAAP